VKLNTLGGLAFGFRFATLESCAQLSSGLLVEAWRRRIECIWTHRLRKWCIRECHRCGTLSTNELTRMMHSVRFVLPKVRRRMLYDVISHCRTRKDDGKELVLSAFSRPLIFQAQCRYSSTKTYKSTKSSTGRRAKEVDTALELKTASDRLGISNLEGWYSIRTRDLDEIASPALRTLQRRHKRSLSTLLRSAFPDHDWQDWRFAQPPKSFFEDLGAQRVAFSWLSKEMGLQSVTGWELVTKQQMERYPGIVKLISTKYGNSLFRTLQVLVSDHNWCVAARPPNRLAA
jgi:hypothetical protein